MLQELCPWQMSTVRTSNGLHSQLEEFLSEVDSINPLTNDHAVETAPGCEWIVRLDPITKSSTYHHIRSGEISSVMPEEYKRYLSTFDAFLCGSDDEAVNLQQTNSDLGPTLSSPRTRQNSTKKNESSEQPTSGLDGLSGIIGYGDSSETDSDPESKSRSVTVTEIHEITHTPDQSSGLSLSASSPVNHLPDSASQDQSFIGPTLPPNRLSATERSPSPTWVCQNQQHKPKKSALEASARTLLDQFTALELNSDSLDALRTRYIQLMTRFEDWLCGKLSSNYFWQKLREAEAELRNYAASSLPRPWSCHWDRSTKRFYYENRADSIYQWDRPREQPKTTKKREKRRPRVKLVDYDVLDQHSWLESPPTIKPQDSQPPVDVVMSSHSSPDRGMSSPFNSHDTAKYNKTDVFQDASGAKKAHLISQLAEFELACQQLEKELDFSRTTCTIIYDPVSSPRVVSLVPATSEDSDSMEQQES
ncbi:Formin-binding protein 4 [Clonorchis sinensis]|uniref:Formin-binding protein 4 n=1 Tax=Clonorchis sinensis TaxID=79923 RepID=A0A8T1MDV2_CLOSI|nr:Formin-binding protein 4 [Clonorchis sinensis]